MILSLKRAFTFGATVVLLAALSVYGMNLLAGKSSTPIESVTTVPPLELKLELQKTEFVQGEPVNITVSLKNIGDTVTEVHFSYTGAYVMFRVLNASDKRTYEEGYAILQAVAKLSLPPSEQVSRTFTWNQFIWNLVGHTIIDEYQAPKGTYKIVGMPAAKIAVVGIGAITLTTPPVTITIM